MPDLPLSASGRTAAEVARACAREAGRIAMAAFGARQDVRVKGRDNFLTETDLAAERAILALRREESPDQAVRAEETAGEAPREGWLWVIDPLDGTQNFSRGIPYFATNIALCHDGEPLLGLTYAPATGEEFFAQRGAGLSVNRPPARGAGVGGGGAGAGLPRLRPLRPVPAPLSLPLGRRRRYRAGHGGRRRRPEPRRRAGGERQ